MSAGSAAIRLIALAGHLRPRKAPATVAKIVQAEEADRTVERKAERARKQAGYFSPEWWESHHFERR